MIAGWGELRGRFLVMFYVAQLVIKLGEGVESVMLSRNGRRGRSLLRVGGGSSAVTYARSGPLRWRLPTRQGP